MISINKSRFLFAVAIVSIFASAVFIAEQLSESSFVQSFVNDVGYLGVFLLAFIAGLNPFVPIPAATFTPIFTEANLAISLIVASLALGTLAADLLGFFLGGIAKDFVKEKYPLTFYFFKNAGEKNIYLIILLITIYAAFIPFPNEVILIPLAVGGFSIRKVLPALITGNLIHNIILVYGALEINQLVF